MKQIRKINVLANSGIKFFTSFSGTMKEPDGSWPAEFDPLLIRPFLMANFHTARLYGKLISIKVLFSVISLDFLVLPSIF